LRIWIVKYGEIIPFGAGRQGSHFFRSGELVRRLATRGHEVTWWTGRFEHQTKQHLQDAGSIIEVPGGSGSRVVLLESPGYTTNVAPRRFYDHYIIGRNFTKAIKGADRPDVIVASMPTPELARASADYAADRKVPLIVDVRDLWPDAISDRMREKIGWFPSWLLYPYERDVTVCLKRANSVTAITRDCLNWAEKKGGRTEQECANDRVFHLASRQVRIEESRAREIEASWKSRGLQPQSKRIFAWAGSLTDQKATNALLDAQRLLPADIRDRIQVVICGGGDLEPKVKELSRAFPHVIYAGYIKRDEVQFLYDQSDFGLLCYDNTLDFQSSFPNKFGEYLMSGLRVFTTIRGALQRDYGNLGIIETVDPRPETIAAGMSACANLPKDARLANVAREVFRRDFDSDIVYEAFCDHIEHMATLGSR